MNKKGVELSVNFLVVLIISIAVIGFGIKFVYNLVGETQKLEQVSGEQLDAKIGNLICADEDKVCIGKDIKKIPRGKVDVFGLRILNTDFQNDPNTGAAKIFTVKIEECQHSTGSSKSDCDSSDSATKKINTLPQWPSGTRTIPVKFKEEAKIAIGAEVPKNAVSGTYIIDVNVYAPDGTTKYVNTKKIYVEVP